MLQLPPFQEAKTHSTKFRCFSWQYLEIDIYIMYGPGITESAETAEYQEGNCSPFLVGSAGDAEVPLSQELQAAGISQ